LKQRQFELAMATFAKGFQRQRGGDVVCLRAGTYPSQSSTTYSQIMKQQWRGGQSDHHPGLPW